MQMTDLPISKAQLVLFIINNFNNCKVLNTFLFFQCMIVRANIYVLPNLFPILNYNKSVVQADLFKLRCETCQSPVINTDSYAYACLSSFPLKRSHDQQNKKSVNKKSMEMKRISNYCKSDRVACFELPEPWYGRDIYKKSWISYSNHSILHF